MLIGQAESRNVGQHVKTLFLRREGRRGNQGAPRNTPRFHGGHAFRCAAGLHDGDVFTWVETESGKRVARDKIRSAAEAGHGDGAAFELLRRLDFRLGHQPVIQRHDATDYIDGFGAREAGAHNPWSGSLYDWCIAEIMAVTERVPPEK